MSLLLWYLPNAQGGAQATAAFHCKLSASITSEKPPCISVSVTPKLSSL